MDRLPCGVHAALVTGSDKNLNAGLLAAGSGADAGEYVHPDHALLFYEVRPGHRVARGGDEDLESACHLGILAQLLDCLHDVGGVLTKLCRYHYVCAEDTVGFLGFLENAGEHLLEDGNVVIGGICVCLLAEVVENDLVGLAGCGCEG